MNTYRVYVSDAAGWECECPDYESVFFGYNHEYVHPARGGQEPCGHLIVKGYRQTLALVAKLNRSGDWISAETNQEEHPRYSFSKL